MKKIRYPLYLVSLILLLTVAVGCSSNNSNKNENDAKATAKADKPNKTTENKSSEPAIPKAADTFKGMMDQEHGVLMKEIVNKDLDGKISWDAHPYINYYNDTFKKKSETSIIQYIKEHKNLTDDQLYDYLIYAIGSGEYQKYYDSLRMYDPGFQAPDLPTGTAEEGKQQQSKKTNVIVLLDASGSMKASVPGGRKIDLAKKAISTFVSSLPKDTNASLLVYGHEGTSSDKDKAKSCSKIDNVYPLKPYDQGEFQTAMKKFNASGWTPLSAAINKAKELLTNYNSAEYTNKIYVVSDGIETCDGDPVNAAQSLQDSKIQATVNIIGFDVDDEGVKQLKQVAKAGKGDFIRVNNQSELDTQIQKKWSPSIFEIAGKQAVNAFDMLDARKDIVNLSNSLNSLSSNEKGRLEGAIQTLHNEKLINDSTKTSLLTKVEEMHRIRQDGIEQLTTQKSQELKDIEQKYQQQIDEWKKQW